jgi:hypothetical protein
MALVVGGRENHKEDADFNIENDIDSVQEEDKDNTKRTPNVSPRVVQKDDIASNDNAKKQGRTACSSSFYLMNHTPASPVSPRLNPPKRRSIEMKHPPAPIREPYNRTSFVPSTLRKTCFQKSTTAIKALPRELSNSNYPHYLDDDYDDDGENDDDRGNDLELKKQQSEKYEVTNTEVIDAYNTRGIYSGTVQRATQMQHGKGKMVYHRGGRVGGRFYDGDWHLGHWHGYSIIQDADRW